jgi:hypothetical protein
MRSTQRRLVRLLTGLALVCATPAAVAVVAGPADAACPSTGCPVPTDYEYSSTFTVTKSAGTVISDDAAHAINCGTVCSVTDTITSPVQIRPTDWPVYTLTASGGPLGYSPSWTGCDSVNINKCVIENDEETGQTVGLTWRDTQSPSLTFNPPAKAGAFTSISASATDNSGSAIQYRWKVDNVVQAATSSSITLASFAEGDRQVEVLATDAAGNISSRTATILLDKHTGVSASSIPGYTNGSVNLTFTIDSDATVRCGLSGEALGACTTTGSYTEEFTGRPDGTYSLTISATDDVGNTASVTRATVLDRTLPIVTIDSGPDEGAMVSTSAVDFAFTASDSNLSDVVCAVDDGAATACADQLQLSGVLPGSHTVTITATDLAGNPTTITRTFTRNKYATHVQAHPKHAKTHRGHPVTLIANHLPAHATGKVVFKKKAKTLCTARVRDGVAKCQTSRHLKRGLYRVKATYLGSTVYAASSDRTSFRIV